MPRESARPAHSLPIRIMHWISAGAILGMMSSGWEIYNASPDLPFRFPGSIALGGWLGGALAWHLTLFWILIANGAAYLAYGTLTGHLRRDLLPPQPRVILRDFWRALTFQLPHRLGQYNGVQRLLYTAVILLLLMIVATGLSIWKPVQLGWLVDLFGGYPIARLLHLGAMVLLLAFLILHLALVMLFPRTLASMLLPLPTEQEIQK